MTASNGANGASQYPFERKPPSGTPARGTGTRPAFEPGHELSTRHGAHSPRVIGPVAAELEQALEAMVVGTPAAHPMFAAVRGALAVKCAQLAKVREYREDKQGGSPLDEEGNVLAAARYEGELVRAIERSLAELGLTPVSAARLGVDLAHGESVIQRMQREAREREGATH